MVVDIGLKRPHCLIALFFKQTQSAKKCSYSKSSNLTEKEAEQYICCVHWSLVHIEIKFKNMVFGQQARVLYKYVNKYVYIYKSFIIFFKRNLIGLKLLKDHLGPLDGQRLESTFTISQKKYGRATQIKQGLAKNAVIMGCAWKISNRLTP